MNGNIFHGKYREDIALPLRLRVRVIQAGDKQKLAEGFERLSPESRYRRFFSQKNTLTTEELRYFTELDGVDHFALGAFELSGEGKEGAVVGVARFLRLPDDSQTAEMAIAVTDDRQGLGVGRALLQRLLVAASERGVRRMRCYLLAENDRMRKLIEHVFGDVALRRDGEFLVGDFPIPERGNRSPVCTDALLELLRLAARGSFMIPTLFALATMENRMRMTERGLESFSRALQASTASTPADTATANLPRKPEVVDSA